MKINSIFSSINGEVSALGQGSLCAFIRLQGCNLRCSYCDTRQAQDYENGGIELSVKDIIRKVQSLKIKNITITGGEPLDQSGELLLLLKTLNLMDDYWVSVETNGSIHIPHWGGLVASWIADWKTLSSGMRKKMHLFNFENLKQKDYVKFVVKDIDDWKDAINVMKKLNKTHGRTCPRFAISPMYLGMKTNTNPAFLVNMMKEDKTCIKNNVILNLQLHKSIGVS